MTEQYKVTVLIDKNNASGNQALDGAVQRYSKGGMRNEVPTGYEFVFTNPDWYKLFITGLLYDLRTETQVHVIDTTGTWRRHRS